MNASMRKRRTRQHIIADLSANHVERHVLLCGHTLERFQYDYGVDLMLFTYTANGEPEDECVFLQLKASDQLRLSRGRATFPFRLDRRDLVRWLRQMLPVILIIYDARTDAAYWLYVQSYFQKLPGFNLFAAGKTVTVNVSRDNIVNMKAVRRFARFRDRVIAQKSKVIHDEN